MVCIRRWRPPMAFVRNDPSLEEPLKIIEAARVQRRFWRKVTVADLQLISIEGLSQAAADIAEQFERRHRQVTSKGWQRWCRVSVAAGGSAVIRWAKRPEKELPIQKLEAPPSKICRVQKEWSDIWGCTPPAEFQLTQLPTECTTVEESIPVRITSKGIERLCARRGSPQGADGTPEGSLNPCPRCAWARQSDTTGVKICARGSVKAFYRPFILTRYVRRQGPSRLTLRLALMGGDRVTLAYSAMVP